MAELDEANTLKPNDIEALKDVVSSILSPNLLIAEIGTWKGHSASIITSLIKPYNGHLYCIDHWEGDGYSQFNVEAKKRDIFTLFRQNMIELGLWDNIHPMYTDSMSAAKIFADNILDLVFIDADHGYECVKADIQAWYPKLKRGGVLCGHDYYHLDEPHIGHRGVTKAIEDMVGKKYKIIHILDKGVTQAMHDTIGYDYEIYAQGSIWKHIKKGDGAWQ